MGNPDYWWNKPGVKKRDLKKMPNGWLNINAQRAAIMADWRWWANQGNRPMSDECRDAVKEIDVILADLEACMKEHGIGFTKEPAPDDR